MDSTPKLGSRSNSTLKPLLQSTEKFASQTWEDEVIRNLQEENNNNNDGNTGEPPSNPITPKVPDSPAKQQDGPKQMTPGELQEEQTRERVGRQILTSVEHRIESAKKELSALWDLAFDIPFGEESIQVVSDKVAHKVGHEFRTSIKQIDIHTKLGTPSNAQMTFKDLNGRSQEVMSYRPKGIYEDKPITDVESDNRDRKRKEIRIRINSIMTQFLGEVIKIVRGEKMDPKSMLFQSEKEKDAQIEVLKGHVIRRNKLLTEQRSAYLKELVILREQVYRKQTGEDENPEDWGHHFDYDGEELNKTLGNDKKQSGVSQKTQITNLKREFAAEKRKMKSQFEYEVKKLETQLKTQLKAREKELTELKSSMSKATEEEKEKIASLEADNKKEMDRAQIVFEEKLKGMQEKHQILMGMIEDQKKDRRSALGEKDELWNERLQSLLKNHQAELDRKEADVKSKQILVDDLKSKIAKLNTAQVMKDNPELESALASVRDEKEKAEYLRQNMQHREQIADLQAKGRSTELILERYRMRNEELLGKLYALEVRLKAREDEIKQAASANQIKTELGRKLQAVRREVQKQRDTGKEKDNHVLLDRVRETERLLDSKIEEMEKQSEEYLDLLKTLSDTEQELDKLHQTYLRKKGFQNEGPDSPSSAARRLEKARQALAQQVSSPRRGTAQGQSAPQPTPQPATPQAPLLSPRVSQPPQQASAPSKVPPSAPQTPKTPASQTPSTGRSTASKPPSSTPSSATTPRATQPVKVPSTPAAPPRSAEPRPVSASVSVTASVSSVATNLGSTSSTLTASISEDRNAEIKKELMFMEKQKSDSLSAHNSPRSPVSPRSPRSPPRPTSPAAVVPAAPVTPREPVVKQEIPQEPVPSKEEEKPQLVKEESSLSNENIEEDTPPIVQKEEEIEQVQETQEVQEPEIQSQEIQPELQPESVPDGRFHGFQLELPPQEEEEEEEVVEEPTSDQETQAADTVDTVEEGSQTPEELYDDPELLRWHIPALSVPPTRYEDDRLLVSPVSVISLSVPEDTEPDLVVPEDSPNIYQQQLEEAHHEVGKLRKENEYLRQLLFGKQEIPTPAAVVPPLALPVSTSAAPVQAQAPVEPPYHFTLPPSELLKKFSREKDPYNIENYNYTQVSQMSVWERLQFRARLLQQKLRFTIENLEKQRRSKMERLLGENELLDPKYNAQITYFYIPKVPVPAPAPVAPKIQTDKTAEAHKWMRKEKPAPKAEPPTPKPRPDVQLQYTGTIPSVTTVREVPIYVTTINKTPISMDYYAEPTETTTSTVALPPALATGYSEPYAGPPPGSLIAVKRPQSATRRGSSSPPKSRPSSATSAPQVPSSSMGPSSRLAASLLPLNIKKRLRFTLPDGIPEKPVRAARTVSVPSSVKAVLAPNSSSDMSEDGEPRGVTRAWSDSV